MNKTKQQKAVPGQKSTFAEEVKKLDKKARFETLIKLHYTLRDGLTTSDKEVSLESIRHFTVTLKPTSSAEKLREAIFNKFGENNLVYTSDAELLDIFRNVPQHVTVQEQVLQPHERFTFHTDLQNREK